MKLKGKIAVITGGGDGIGRCACLKFAREGARVITLEICEDAGRETARLAAAEGGEVDFIQTDVSKPESVRTAFEKIDQKYGRIDTLYNNASVFWGKKDSAMADIDLDTFETILRINLFGLVYCSKFAIPLLIKSGGGSIIHTASSAGVIGIPGCTAYTASKGATVSLTRSMAVEYGPDNIRTNVIAPAAIATPMVIESDLTNPNFDEQEFLTKGTPLRRWGKPEEIANIAAFLASDEAAYLNGAIIVADGGITIR
jgi:NAD(P)-dependent dehydrogenase (short-subunit alcohol dehydrogenase family)